MVLLALLLAGCAAPLPPATPGALPMPPGAAGWHLDCPRLADWPDPCTSRASVTSGPANENWLALNPKDPQNVVAGAKDYNPNATDCVWVGLATSHDGGRSWLDQYIGGLKDERAQPTSPLFGYTCNTDPMFAFADDGTLYDVVEVYGSGPGSGTGDPFGVGQELLEGNGANTMFITVSEDGGDTFGPLARVADGVTPAVLQDRTMIAANPKSGSVHFIWSQRQDLTVLASPAAGRVAQALVSTSRDHGATWGQPVLASAPEPMFDIPSFLTAADDGTVYAGWARSLGFEDTKADIQVAVSLDDGRAFAAPVTVATAKFMFAPHLPNSEFYVPTNPQIAVDRSGGPREGWVYVVWDDDLGGHLDPMLSSSSDGGATWSAPVPVSGVPDAHDRFHPAIAVDAWGAVHVTYNDRRYDPGNKLLDLTWAIAPDGAHFTSFRVTAGSFDGDLGFHQTGVPFIGDYNGLGCAASQGGGPGGPVGVCYASFADTRDGRSELVVARLVRG
jgi:hypothetical protein